MMKFLAKLPAKLKDKNFVQNILVELVGDIIMLILGLIGAYIIRVYVIGF